MANLWQIRASGKQKLLIAREGELPLQKVERPVPWGKWPSLPLGLELQKSG